MSAAKISVPAGQSIHIRGKMDSIATQERQLRGPFHQSIVARRTTLAIGFFRISTPRFCYAAVQER